MKSIDAIVPMAILYLLSCVKLFVLFPYDQHLSEIRVSVLLQKKLIWSTMVEKGFEGCIAFVRLLILSYCINRLSCGKKSLNKVVLKDPLPKLRTVVRKSQYSLRCSQMKQHIPALTFFLFFSYHRHEWTCFERLQQFSSTICSSINYP